MRGEHHLLGEVVFDVEGSSPHARGTLPRECTPFSTGGIIPACAGNTVRYSFGLPDEWDHPRMRREHIDLAASSSRTAGSSPHARGTRVMPSSCHFRIRIIPACAGNTVSSRRPRLSTRDHPRMRGEHPKCTYKACRKRGSSPHARGTLYQDCWRSGYAGIIPACAGNTQ